MKYENCRVQYDFRYFESFPRQSGIYFLPLFRMFFGRPRSEFRSSEFLLAGIL